MKLPNSNFIVVIVENEFITGYYAIDSNSGGYPYLSDSFRYAEIYTDKQKAIDVVNNLNKRSETPREPQRDGTIYPDTDISTLLNMGSKKPKASGQAAVLEIDVVVVASANIHGEIKKPSGFVYN